MPGLPLNLFLEQEGLKFLKGTAFGESGRDPPQGICGANRPVQRGTISHVKSAELFTEPHLQQEVLIIGVVTDGAPAVADQHSALDDVVVDEGAAFT